MRDTSYALAVVLVGTFVVTWTVGRVVERFDYPLRVVRNLVARVCVGVILVLAAVAGVMHGAVWLVLAPVLLLVALWQLVATALVVRVWWREGLGEAPTSAP